MVTTKSNDTTGLTWRTFLGDIIQHPPERQRLASLLGVAPITLTRWVKGQVDPRPLAFSRLLVALPEYRSYLLNLIQQEFPSFVTAIEEEERSLVMEIPSAFYTEVIAEFTHLAPSEFYWSLRQRILQQALKQLDPTQGEVCLMLTLCVPPASDDGFVRSQREIMGVGIPPWGGTFGGRSILMGAEVLAGTVLSSGRPIFVQGDQPGIHASPKKSALGGSVNILPLLRNDRIAGTLLIFNAQAGSFSLAQQELITQYSELLSLTLPTDMFYSLDRIRLVIMPPAPVQKQQLAQFKERVTKLLLEEQRQQRFMTHAQAEHLVWLQFEEELARLASPLS